MKLKTLLMVVAMLCVSLFVVACGGGDDTTATPGTNAPGATTTKAQTTKTTTTKKTTTSKVTTTTVTTTLSPDFYTKIPAKLPNNETYTINTRVGLESENDYLSFGSGEGKIANIVWGTPCGIYGNGLSFACSMTAGTNGTPNRAEGNLKLVDPIFPTGIKGVLWYVDFSKMEVDTAKEGPCASVTINGNKYRSNKNGTGAGLNIGYYLKDGEWVQTTNVNSCRMQLPQGFAGWVYVPLTSYSGEGTLYDSTTGLGIEGEFITDMNLYTDHYVYSDTKSIVFDEILFVQ